MNKFYILIFTLFISFSVFAQDNEEEISIEDQRNNKIKELLETVEVNKSIYIKEDQLRINEFLDLIDERQSMLSKAKTDLQNENLRNKRLEKEFEENEKLLAELEERLQIKTFSFATAPKLKKIIMVRRMILIWLVMASSYLLFCT